MAGDWIKMRADLQTHPKVVRISSALRADRLRVIGGLHAVWCLFDAHAEDGQLIGYTPDALDEMIGFPGFCEAMQFVGWIEFDGESLSVPRFDAHNGQSAKRRSMETERKRESRKVSAHDADKMRSREEKRREEVNPPYTPQGGNENGAAAAQKVGRDPAAKQKRSDREVVTFVEWREKVRAAGEKAVSDYRGLWEYAEKVKLPREFIELAWWWFADHYSEDEKGKRKRYKDWRGVFLRAVKGGWPKYWYWSERDEQYLLTTVGQQAELACREAA